VFISTLHDLTVVVVVEGVVVDVVVLVVVRVVVVVISGQQKSQYGLLQESHLPSTNTAPCPP